MRNILFYSSFYSVGAASHVSLKDAILNPMMAYDNNSMADNTEAKPKVVKGVTKFMYTDKHTGKINVVLSPS